MYILTPYTCKKQLPSNLKIILAAILLQNAMTQNIITQTPTTLRQFFSKMQKGHKTPVQAASTCNKHFEVHNFNFGQKATFSFTDKLFCIQKILKCSAMPTGAY